MSRNEALALLPLIVLAAAVVITTLVAAFWRHTLAVLLLTLAGLVGAWIALFAAPAASVAVTPLLAMDGFARFFMGLFFFATIFTALLAYGDPNRPAAMEEFFLLLSLATLGAAVLAASAHFASFFLGLELLSVSLYGLIAYPRTRERSIEAGVKYLVLAAASAAFLLFGMALVYNETGTMDFAKLVPALGQSGLILTAGLGMLVVGIGFKLAVVPFHLWTPDVYQGAPAPVTAFVATVSKGALVALLLRLFGGIAFPTSMALTNVFTLIAVASIFAGNLLALLQNNVKRLLAYSSIAHLGYILIAFLAGGNRATVAIMFYLVAYFLTTLVAFGVVTLMSDGHREAERVEDYRGLFWTRPWMATAFTAAMLSLAGIPLTAGFIGKFYVVRAGIGSALWALVVLLVINSAIGLFYYLRVIVVMCAPAPPTAARKMAPIWLGAGAAMTLLTLLVIALGVYPNPVVDVIQTALAPARSLTSAR
jgi:NADH-quinone oxidoreductase subunit N